jgi:hypothetical protein
VPAPTRYNISNLLSTPAVPGPAGPAGPAGTISSLTKDGTVSGTALTVTGVQGVPVAATAPTDGQALVFSAAAGTYGPAAVTTNVPLFFAGLATKTPSATRQFVMLDGYTAVGDGGGGLFVWSSTSTATVDSGTIAAVTGMGTGRWLRADSGPLQPQWFGAPVTPSGFSADSAFALLFAAALAQHRKIFAVGDFTFSGQLIPAGSITIDGTSWAYQGAATGFHDAGWLSHTTSAGNVGGTVFRFSNTAMPSNGLNSSAGGTTWNLSNIAIIGPGTGTTSALFQGAGNCRINTTNVLLANWYIGYNPQANEGEIHIGLNIASCVYGLVVGTQIGTPAEVTIEQFLGIKFYGCTYPLQYQLSVVTHLRNVLFEACATGPWHVGPGCLENSTSDIYQELTGTAQYNSASGRSLGVVVGMTMCPATFNGRVYVCTVGGTTGVGEPTGWSSNLSGTVAVTNGSTTATFGTAQTLIAGAEVIFAAQPGIPYFLSAGITGGTTATLTYAYGGPTAAATTTQQVGSGANGTLTDGAVTWQDLGPGGGTGGSALSLQGAAIVIDSRNGAAECRIYNHHISEPAYFYVLGSQPFAIHLRECELGNCAIPSQFAGTIIDCAEAIGGIVNNSTNVQIINSGQGVESRDLLFPSYYNKHAVYWGEFGGAAIAPGFNAPYGAAPATFQPYGGPYLQAAVGDITEQNTPGVGGVSRYRCTTAGPTGRPWVRYQATTIPGGSGQVATIIDSNGNLQQCSITGMTGATPPTWNKTLSGTTVDSAATWINRGPAAVWTQDGSVGPLGGDALTGTPLQRAPATIPITTGTVTLTQAQLAASKLILTGTLSGAVTIDFTGSVFGATNTNGVAGDWEVDYGQVVFGAFAITFKSGSATSVLVPVAGKLSNISTDGANHIVGDWQSTAGVTFAGDLAGNSSTQQVVAITGAAGTLPVASTAAAIQWSNTTATPSISIAALAALGSGTGAAGTSLKISPQPGQQALSGTGGAGGVLTLSSAASGAGSVNPGTPGNLELNVPIGINGATSASSWVSYKYNNTEFLQVGYGHTGVSNRVTLSLGAASTGFSFLANTSASQLMEFAVGSSGSIYYDTPGFNIRDASSSLWRTETVGAAYAVQWRAGATSVTYNFLNNTTGAGASVSWSAQTTTAASSAGGNFTISSGGGTTKAGQVNLALNAVNVESHLPTTGTLNSQTTRNDCVFGVCETVSSATATAALTYTTASGTGGLITVNLVSRATTTGTGIAVGDTAVATYVVGYKNVGGTVTLSTAGLTLVGAVQTTAAAMTSTLTATVATNVITINVVNTSLCTVDSEVYGDVVVC